VGGGTEWARQAHQALGKGERVVGIHQTPDMIRKERPEGHSAEDAWGGCDSPRRGRYASGVKVVFADGSGMLFRNILEQIIKTLSKTQAGICILLPEGSSTIPG